MTEDVMRGLNYALEGRYRVEREVGAGGMATVYLAEDLRHARRVALKLLRPELAAVVGAERFLAEIKTTASLQHPHILPLFDSGEAGSFLFYVMPYVEGETLRTHLDREQQMGVEAATSLVGKVADALHHAHEQGIVHRDVKPANILLTPGHEPLIADFGIALAVSQAGGHRLTETGLSLGTPHYMSPEQAAGDERVGRASDVYSLGCVLYEMLTGEPPYTGVNAQAVLARILTQEARPAVALRPSVPPNVDAAIRKALEKSPADRFSTTSDFAGALRDHGFRHGPDEAAPTVPVGAWRAAALAAFGVAVATTALWLGDRGGVERPQLTTRAEWIFEPGQEPRGAVTFSPDGTELVYVGPGRNSIGTQLWIRPRAEPTARPISGTDDAFSVATSPDGSSVAFVETTSAQLKVVSAGGGIARALVDSAAFIYYWAPDDMIYYGPSSHDGIYRVPSAGGTGSRFTELQDGECDHEFLSPSTRPDEAIFTVLYCDDDGDVGTVETWALDLVNGSRRFVSTGGAARVARPNLLLTVVYAPGEYATDPPTILTAVRVDQRSLAAITPRVTLAIDRDMIDYAVSPDGLVLHPAAGGGAELVWLDRSGNASSVEPGWMIEPPSAGYGWSVSPDGSRMAVTHAGDIWVKEPRGGAMDRLTFNGLHPRHPTWDGTGEYVTYFEWTETRDVPYRRRADGLGQPEQLLDDPRPLLQGSLSRDGTWMVLRTRGDGITIGGRDLYSFRPGVDSVAAELIATDFIEEAPALSPDGAWLAYTSNESGVSEVYVRPFPNVVASRTRVSLGGGLRPVWARDGSELYYLDSQHAMIAASVRLDGEFRVTAREELFRLGPEYFVSPPNNFYDVAPDGRFLFARGSRSWMMIQNPLGVSSTRR